MEANGRTCRREKAIKRKAMLEKKRLIEGMIEAASSVKDHLSCFPHLRHYQKNGLYLHLESGRGSKLSHRAKQYIQDLLKLNMEAPYGSEWPAEEKMKRREMIADEARYIFVHEISNKDANGGSELMDKKSTCNCNGPIVGFVHYRFVLEEEVPVVYVYELQLEPHVQGKGLGKFLMLLIELIACESKMGAVVLTVQRENLLAMDFYLNKLGYCISSISPSRVDPLLGVDKSYEILCKAFDNEAQAVLKGERYPLDPETFVGKTCEKTAGTTSTSSATALGKVSPPFAKRTKMSGDRRDKGKQHAGTSRRRRVSGSQPKFRLLDEDSTFSPPFPTVASPVSASISPVSLTSRRSLASDAPVGSQPSPHLSTHSSDNLETDILSASRSSGRSRERLFIEPRGDHALARCCHCIGKIIKMKFDGPWRSYEAVPTDVRDLWFSEFEKKFTWNEEDRVKARKIFDIISSEYIKNKLFKTKSTNQIERQIEIAGGSKKGRAHGLVGLTSTQSYRSHRHGHTEREMELEIEVQGLRREVAARTAAMSEMRAHIALLTSMMAQQQEPPTHMPYPTPMPNMPYLTPPHAQGTPAVFVNTFF